MRRSLLICLTLIFASAWAESFADVVQDSSEVSDLLEKLKRDRAARSDTAVVHTFLQLSHLYRYRPVQALQYADSAEALAKQIRFTKGEVLATSRRIFPEMLQGHYFAAISHARLAVPQIDAKREPIEYLRAVNAYGTTLSAMKATRDAREQFEEVLKVAKVVGDSERVSAAYTNIGTTYFTEGDYPTSLVWHTRAYESNKRAGRDALTINLVNLGEVYLVLGELSTSYRYLTEALAEARFRQDARIQAAAKSLLARLADKQKQPDVAKRFALEAWQEGSALGIVNAKIGSSKTLANVEFQLRNYAAALEWQDRYRALNDLAHSPLQRSRLSEMLMAIEAQRRDNEMTMMRTSHDQQVIWQAALAAVMVISMLFGWVSFRGLQRARRTTDTIRRQEVELNQANDRLAELLEELRSKNEAILAATRQLNEVNTKQLEVNSQLQAETQKITASLQLARQVQRMLLPPVERLSQTFEEHFVIYQPRDVVSGDLYFVQQVGGKHIVAAIDCTGHGVPGAFMTMIAHTQLSQIILDRGVIDPGKILADLHVGIRRALRQDRNDSRDGLDIALCVIDPRQKSISYAGANLALAYLHNGQLYELKPDKYSVGGVQHEAIRTFSTSHLLYDRSHTFYIFSDGIYHQFGGPNKRKLSLPRLYEFLQETNTEALADQRGRLMARIEAWRGEIRQLDDWMVLGFRIN